MNVERALSEILDYLDANFPRSGDEAAYAAESYTVPAGSALTVVFRVVSEWLVKIKHLYADAAPNCSYLWVLSGLNVRGNEVTFYKAVEVKAGGLITLTVSNSGDLDQAIDVLVEGWARRVVK
jgi:hypothetical protein